VLREDAEVIEINGSVVIEGRAMLFILSFLLDYCLASFSVGVETTGLPTESVLGVLPICRGLIILYMVVFWCLI